MTEAATPLKSTPMTAAHVASGGRMVPFAGYSMPVQYQGGIIAEHNWTRQNAGLFDVSHMGPCFLRLSSAKGDPADHERLAKLIEPLLCGDIASLSAGRQKYSLLMAGDGGILDDLMIGRPTGGPDGVVYLVVNAGTKDADFARVSSALGEAVSIDRRDDGGLIAVQGPKAMEVVAAILPAVADMRFMDVAALAYGGETLIVSRSGYTGEDGFEILVPKALAADFWARLAADDRARPIGLGARDSLRLEAGLPLYGHDIDETTSPVEADLDFAISKKRLRTGDVAGALRLAQERNGSLHRVRIGLTVLDGAPAREGAQITNAAGDVIGQVTSGGFSPTLSKPIAMGYVPPAFAKSGTSIGVVVRGKTQVAEVTAMPFVPHRYAR